MQGLGELWADCDLRSWWDAISVDTEQCLRRPNQGRGNHYLNGFLAKESRSKLQSEGGFERSGLTAGQRVSKREIRTQREISRRVETQKESRRVEMAVNRLRDRDRFDGASNFVIWKARILAVLDQHRNGDHALKA